MREFFLGNKKKRSEGLNRFAALFIEIVWLDFLLKRKQVGLQIEDFSIFLELESFFRQNEKSAHRDL